MRATKAKKKDQDSPESYMLLRNNSSPSTEQAKVASKSMRYYNKGNKEKLRSGVKSYGK